MTVFYGKVGYMSQEQTAPGVWRNVTKEISYYGNIITNNRLLQAATNSTNDNISVNNQISFVADAYAFDNFMKIQWVEWNGQKFKVSSVQVARPRIVVDLGGLYNGD